MRGLSWRTHDLLIASSQTETQIPVRRVHKGTTGGERSLRTRELVMNPVFTALVSAWQFGWGDSDSGDGYGSYGSSYGGGTWT
jgi:hypothetical protein